jgi:hypothetical protein
VPINTDVMTDENHNRPKFTKIVWTKDNVKTLGIHHGYNIQNDEIWKSIIDKNEKLCPQ